MPEIRLRRGVADFDRVEWNSVVAGASPFLDWDWLSALEESGCVGAASGWEPRPLALALDGEIAALCPLYRKSNSEGEFVFDHAWASAAEGAGIAYYPKLLVGVPFTPAGGSRLVVRPGADAKQCRTLLAGALLELCQDEELSGVHVNFCPEHELAPLAEAGFAPRIGLQYHWRNEGYRDFEDYLARFRSKRRNQIRRERREVREAGIEFEILRGDAIGPEHLEPIFACYRATIGARFWGRQYLNRRFFELLIDRFRERLCLIFARRGDAVVAATFNVIQGGVLYGRYWGALEPIRHLHFETCYYRAIDFCIEQGLQRFEPGAGGDYKWLRGFEAVPTYSAHHLAEPRLARAVGDFLARERSAARHALDRLAAHSPLQPAAAQR